VIQVCSRCGTRWNVRDRQRVWCPRCQGSLLPPSAEQAPQWSTRPSDVSKPGAAGPSQRLPAGYRWIAVRPGAPPPARRTPPPLGPTPRYAVIPRWGLQDRFEPPAPATSAEPPRTATRMVQTTVLVTLLALAFAVVIHIANYALLLYNRSRLLNPIVAGAATWAGVAASVLVFFALIATTVVLTNWLVVRRALSYAEVGVEDPRPAWQLWVCCLVPLVNLFWAPVFVLELARVERRLSWLRTPIVVWWCAWWVSFLVSAFSFATSFTSDSQGIANNTVAVTIAYLAALAALLLTVRMYQGFEHRSVAQRPTKRWVVVAQDASPTDAEPQNPEPDDATRVEPDRKEPAASGIIST